MTSVRVAVLASAIVAAGLLAAPGTSYAETRGQDRRGDRGEARDTRQDGREEGRDAKQECRDEGGHGIECRGEKHGTKQDAREDARDEKHDGPD